MTPHQEIQRGEQAKHVLQHPLYQEAFEVVREEIQRQWQNSPVRDTQGRETLWLMAKIVDRLEQHLQSVLESGSLAKATMAHRVGRAPTPF